MIIQFIEGKYIELYSFRLLFANTNIFFVVKKFFTERRFSEDTSA